jgi:hypothetical protein
MEQEPKESFDSKSSRVFARIGGAVVGALFGIKLVEISGDNDISSYVLAGLMGAVPGAAIASGFNFLLNVLLDASFLDHGNED